MAQALMRIEAAKQALITLPITPTVLHTLRETAKLYTTHYSTRIEGNRLTQEQVQEVVTANKHIKGRERDEHEVKGYYRALEQVEQWSSDPMPPTEQQLKQLHGLVMAGGAAKSKASPYRDGQNVIKDSLSGAIVYMPPEANDVPKLMQALFSWLALPNDLPTPLVAGLAHYQLATIHPYYDGNGRTARLLTTLVLHKGGYDLKGIYSLEAYYATNLPAYYKALSLGSSHNYYLGRAEADLTPWLGYFCEGMADACEKVKHQALQASKAGANDASDWLRQLDPRQRQALTLFQQHEVITAKAIEQLFGFKARSATALCKQWVDAGFLVMVNPSKKARTYGLAKGHQAIVSNW
jgi:Fic family protein